MLEDGTLHSEETSSLYVCSCHPVEVTRSRLPKLVIETAAEGEQGYKAVWEPVSLSIQRLYLPFAEIFE